FGNAPTFSVSGTMVNDLNGNGVKDAGEPGLSGWTIYADLNGNGTLDSGEPSATTDSSGNYTITPINSATVKIRDVAQHGWTGTGYQVGQILQAGFQCTAPTNCVYTSVSPTSGQAITGKDFTDTSTQTVQGTVYEDRNHNGAKDSGEPGLSGWTVYVDSNNNG